MNILYPYNNKEKFLAYNKYYGGSDKMPVIIFHHGLLSDMNGKKAISIENYCKEKNYSFIRFDNFGHGKSSGEFLEQTISSWYKGLQIIIKNLADHPIILVGSSMGGWITLLAANEQKNKNNIIGVVGLAAAPDFSEELIWNKISSEQKQQINQHGNTNISGTDVNCNSVYPVSMDLIEDGRNHLLLNKTAIDIKCPVHLIHGMQDVDVPHTISERILSKITNNDVILKLIKGGDHRLSREKDIDIICNSIDEIVKNTSSN